MIEVYREQLKENLYRDLRNAYYTGCFAQVEKPTDFYKSIIDSIDSRPQTGEEMFNFLKNMADRSGKAQQEDALDFHFKIPLKLTPGFDVGVFNYVYRMEEDLLELYLPDVNLSLDNQMLKPVNGVYTLKPGLVRVKYNGQVYTIVLTRR